MAKILQTEYKGENIIIISAMGKTTNALKKWWKHFMMEERSIAVIWPGKQQHLEYNEIPVTINWQQAENHLKDFFTEVEWLLHDKPVREYDYYYDQVVCSGELLSTANDERLFKWSRDKAINGSM